MILSRRKDTIGESSSRVKMRMKRRLRMRKARDSTLPRSKPPGVEEEEDVAVEVGEEAGAGEAMEATVDGEAGAVAGEVTEAMEAGEEADADAAASPEEFAAVAGTTSEPTLSTEISVTSTTTTTSSPGTTTTSATTTPADATHIATVEAAADPLSI